MKKIVIFIIVVLVLGVMAMYSCISNSRRIEQEKINENIANTAKEEIKENEIVESQELAKEENINAGEIQEQQKPIEKEQHTQSNIETRSIAIKEEVKPTEEIINVETPEHSQAIQEQPKTEETTIRETPSNVVVETKKEEFKRNDTMIEKIKQTIINNETENMKNYGYNIVVDSSIKDLTNQFTYTELRVKSNIKYSFGTIRIYAEDYLVNGQLVMTECYIL